MRPIAGLVRRFQVAFLAVFLFTLAWSASAAPGPGLLLVLLSGEDSAALINPATGETVARIPTGKVPHEVVVSPDGSWAYVADSGGPQQPGHSISVLNLRTRELEATFEIEGCTSPHGIALDPAAERLWVTCAPDRVVIELDPRTGRVLNRWETGQEGSWMLAATPSGDRLFTANLEGNSVTQIDPAAGAARVVGTVEAAIGIEVSPDARELWVSSLSGNTIHVFGLPGGNSLARFSSGGKNPVRVRFTPDGSQVWVTHTESNTVDMFDAASRSPLGSVSLSEPPKGLMFSPDGKWAFAGLVAGDEVAVISVAARKLERLLRVGRGPEGMAWVPQQSASGGSGSSAPYNNWHPAWSPDGSRIVFHSDRDGDDEIYLMNADGSGQTRLTFARGRDAHPTFSPDGRRIVFQSPRDSEDPLEVEIYVMNADGSAQTRLTRNPGFDGVPVFSPDGRKIAFQLKPPGPWEQTRWQIYLMNPDGSGQVQLTCDAADNQVPNWSPDGKKLVYFSNREGDDDIFVMDSGGGNPFRLTHDPGRPDRAACFSPDGSRIAFMAGDYTDGDIYVMNADGSDLTRLTSGLKGSGIPFWSPDGTRLLFNSVRDGKRDIFLLNADGAELRRLTFGGEGRP